MEQKYDPAPNGYRVSMTGTTGVAAIKEGIPCLLIEESEENCLIAAKRLEEASFKVKS